MDHKDRKWMKGQQTLKLINYLFALGRERAETNHENRIPVDPYTIVAIENRMKALKNENRRLKRALKEARIVWK